VFRNAGVKLYFPALGEPVKIHAVDGFVIVLVLPDPLHADGLNPVLMISKWLHLQPSEKERRS